MLLLQLILPQHLQNFYVLLRKLKTYLERLARCILCVTIRSFRTYYLKFQVSSVSAAYTVKSLPGAYLYIPVLDSAHQPPQSVPSLPSVKRALSDPQIHFAANAQPHSSTSGHPIILTVNPNSDAGKKNLRLLTLVLA